jgi:hypothetical protein
LPVMRHPTGLEEEEEHGYISRPNGRTSSRPIST